MKLTPKQRLFVNAKAEGATNRDAAMLAGYSATAANTRASELMRRPEIKAAIKKAGGVVTKPANESRMLPRYGSSLDLLQHTYNNPLMPDAMRIRAAEQALPYEHAKVGELGKKAKAKDAAEKIVSGQRGKFTPKAAPGLHLVKS